MGRYGNPSAVGAGTFQLMSLWHATESERRRQLPGDEFLAEARESSTHATTIAAPPEAVWPWLLQMGCGRGGWYSYDRLDNQGIPSAEAIQPELQDVHVGDVLPSYAGSKDAFEVLQLAPPTHLLLSAYFRLPDLEGMRWEAPRPKAFLRSTWGFYLEKEQGNTRLLVRSRTVFQPRWVGFLVNLIMGPAHLVMQRKQLLNLRARACQVNP